MKVIVIPDEAKRDAMKVGWQVLKWLTDHQIPAVLSPSVNALAEDRFDMAILLGGDGFITTQSFWLARADVPLLAINFGKKGFLAVAEKDNWPKVLEGVVGGHYMIERRPILRARLAREHDVVDGIEAVGDIYIRHRAWLIEMEVAIDGKTVYERMGGDGVIVATPTATTAYNLSAGGPIFETGIAVTPICPHAVNIKPLQLTDNHKIEIVYLGPRSGAHSVDNEGCLLFVDGKPQPIKPGERVVITQSARKTSFAIPDGFSFLEAIQRKLGLSR